MTYPHVCGALLFSLPPPNLMGINAVALGFLIVLPAA